MATSDERRPTGDERRATTEEQVAGNAPAVRTGARGRCGSTESHALRPPKLGDHNTTLKGGNPQARRRSAAHSAPVAPSSSACVADGTTRTARLLFEGTRPVSRSVQAPARRPSATVRSPNAFLTRRQEASAMLFRGCADLYARKAFSHKLAATGGLPAGARPDLRYIPARTASAHDRVESTGSNRHRRRIESSHESNAGSRAPGDR